jgi:UDP-glucuronate decarboxylase
MLEPHISKALSQSDRRIVITGATGWLGRASLDLLRDCLGTEFESRVRCFGSQSRTLGNGHVIEQSPLAELATLPSRPTLVLHFAFLTKDRAEAMDEALYCQANRTISQTVLDALQTIGTEGLFIASSGAAAFADDAAVSPAMRLYGSLKRDDERSFADWADRTGKTAAIARIFNISGPHINKHSSYALACFILDALAGGPISIRAPHDVRRGYVAVRELLSLVFAILLENQGSAIRFDTGGSPMEMGEIAREVASQLGPCPIERPDRVAGPSDDYFGNDHAYRLLLDRYGIVPVPFARQIAETANFLALNQRLPVEGGVAVGAKP